MTKLISDLQNDIINGEDDLQILHKALILSKQSNLDDFTIFINNELDGYDEFEELPDYRIFECTLMEDDFLFSPSLICREIGRASCRERV